ncbi:hypothetical protein DBV15_07760 [Temnothorax longispinosus]|uniref:Uncharacterized protein n=1 Tax=Temnothorax longispinosus TaxID=300112 RepID=A0A4S2L284_9HYME|nr:hypothetical protein DBV15_07760 [Temnothorax longispinosus]
MKRLLIELLMKIVVSLQYSNNVHVLACYKHLELVKEVGFSFTATMPVSCYSVGVEARGSYDDDDIIVVILVVVLIFAVVNRDDTCSSSGGEPVRRARLWQVGVRAGRENVVPCSIHGYAMWKPRDREADGPTWTGGVPTVWTVEATFSRLSKRFPSMLLTHRASQHAYRTIIRTIILVLLFEHSCHRTLPSKMRCPLIHVIR